MNPPARAPRPIVTWVAGGFFAAATAVVVLVVFVPSATAGASSVAVGALDERNLLTIAMTTALISLFVGLWSITSPRWMLPLKIIGVVLAGCAGAVAAFLTVLTVEASATPLLHDGCDTGYVVIERSFLTASSGVVYRQDGPFIVTQMARTSGNNAYQPFSMGSYTVTETRGAFLVSYAYNRPIGSMEAPPSETSFSVPVIEGRTPQCGIQITREQFPLPGTAAPSAAATPLTAESIDESMRELLEASFDAASGTVVDASGAPLDPSVLPISSAPCVDGSRNQRELQVDFRTDDNAASLAQILRVWDRAGFDKDRAMQEEIRYSESEPVARMSARDTSSIDGLIHLTVASACGAFE